MASSEEKMRGHIVVYRVCLRLKRFVVAGFTYLVGKSCTFLDETKKKSSTAC